MNLADVNILVGALNAAVPSHGVCRAWLESQLASSKLFAVSTQVLAAVARISTNPKIQTNPASLAESFAFANRLLDHPFCVVVEPGARHWSIFAGLCTASDARGNLISDAWLAALAIEHHLTLITLDRDFRKFPGLDHAPPLIAP